VVFVAHRANAEMVTKFHVALRASHATPSMLTLNIRPKAAPLYQHKTIRKAAPHAQG
jgi:hypothetical protein